MAQHPVTAMKLSLLSRPYTFLNLCTLIWLLAVMPCRVDGASSSEPRWWKGNLHTHSLWSDGNDYPEQIVRWYQENGYQFLALSDHNIFQEGQRWIDATNNAGGQLALDKYIAQFGTNWVEQRVVGGKHEVRLKPLSEFRPLFERPEEFLLIPGLELTDQHLTSPVHMNLTNGRDLIKPQGGDSVFDVMQNNVNAVIAQREATGQAMLLHLNHPNFGWGVTAEELMRVSGEQFFEVYNGHPAVRNEGDETHADTERMWDIVLTWRLAVLGMPPMYGLATDDSHDYFEIQQGKSNTGRGWVMVRSRFLTPEHLIASMEAGEFYASNGVMLEEIREGEKSLSIIVREEPGVTYTIQFIGTRKGFDRANTPIRTTGGEKLRITHRYSGDVGAVLKQVEGKRANYEFSGDEIYVRAKVTSSKLKENPYATNEVEVAWTQPVIP